MSDRIAPMKSEDQITARIKELREQLKKQKDNQKDHARWTGANRTTLGIKRRRQLEGEIAGLEWVLRIGSVDPMATAFRPPATRINQDLAHYPPLPQGGHHQYDQYEV